MSGPNSKRTDVTTMLRLRRGITSPILRPASLRRFALRATARRPGLPGWTSQRPPPGLDTEHQSAGNAIPCRRGVRQWPSGELSGGVSDKVECEKPRRPLYDTLPWRPFSRGSALRGVDRKQTAALPEKPSRRGKVAQKCYSEIIFRDETAL